MASSNTESAGDVTGDGTRAGPVELSRAVEHREHGVVVTFELENRGGEAARVRLEQALPPARLVEDAGFQPDAAPDEWTAEGDCIQGEARVPATSDRSLVFGLRYEPDVAVPDSLHPPTLEEVSGSGTPADGGTTAEAADDTAGDAEDDTAGDAEDDPPAGDDEGRVTTAVREVLGTLGGDEEPETTVADPGGPGGDGAIHDAGTDTDADTDSDSDPADSPLAAATDGGQAAADDTDASGGTDPGGVDAPEPRDSPTTGPESLEAAVESVEADLDRETDGTGPAPDDDLLASEGDLQTSEEDPLAPENEDEGEGGTDTLRRRDVGPDVDEGDGGAGDVAAALERLPDTGSEADGGTGSVIGAGTPADAAAGASGRPESPGGGTTGPAEVRLSRVESRLSKLEAYEDALAAFIEESGTAEEVQATAREATAAVEELREEVRTARAERQQLREDVDELRAELAGVADLRASLLDALGTQSDDDRAGGAAD